MTDLPSDRLASPEPKCANCKWFGHVARPQVRPTRWYEPKTATGTKLDTSKPKVRIPGKGACMEPELQQVWRQTYPEQTFFITDLMLCSRWERKE